MQKSGVNNIKSPNFASTFFLSASSPNSSCSSFFSLYEFFRASRAASASISSLLVSSESSNVERLKVDDALLLPLSVLLKVTEHLRF